MHYNNVGIFSIKIMYDINQNTSRIQTSVKKQQQKQHRFESTTSLMEVKIISLLGATYLFAPVAIETSGAIGPRSRVFLRELGRRVQRGNAAVILDCIPSN